MNARHRLLIACAVVLPAVSALAQGPQIRPGLWEETVKMKMGGADADAAMEKMKARLAAMPPDQRAAVEKMMAGRGLGMAPGGAANVVRVCYTREQLARGFTPGSDSRCTRKNVSTSGNVTRYDFACTTAQKHSVVGHGTLTTMGDSAFAFSSESDSTSDKGTMHMSNDIAGKFVSGDCGDVKPIEIPHGN
ncbi:MAG: DUF3617 domain-containing protein [Burkholderiales bacterium]|nr:DUF3617 domain-containing protein [Burkholderiales bacterium]